MRTRLLLIAVLFFAVSSLFAQVVFETPYSDSLYGSYQIRPDSDNLGGFGLLGTGRILGFGIDTAFGSSSSDSSTDSSDPSETDMGFPFAMRFLALARLQVPIMVGNLGVTPYGDVRFGLQFSDTSGFCRVMDAGLQLSYGAGGCWFLSASYGVEKVVMSLDDNGDTANHPVVNVTLGYGL